MDQQQITRDDACFDVGKHTLELRAILIACRSASIDIARDNDVTTLGAEPFRMGQLIRNRQVVIGLPRGRDAGIDNNAHAASSCLVVIGASDWLGFEGIRFYHRGDQLGKMGFYQRQFLGEDWQWIG